MRGSSGFTGNKHKSLLPDWSLQPHSPSFQHNTSSQRGGVHQKKQCNAEGYVRKKQIKWGFVSFWGYQSCTKSLGVLKHNQRADFCRVQRRADCKDTDKGAKWTRCVLHWFYSSSEQKKKTKAPKAERSHCDLSVCGAQACVGENTVRQSKQVVPSLQMKNDPSAVKVKKKKFMLEGNGCAMCHHTRLGDQMSQPWLWLCPSGTLRTRLSGGVY